MLTTSRELVTTLVAVITVIAIITARAADSDTSSLEGYTLSKGPVALQGVSDNLSGITYCGKTDTLFAVQNAPTQVVELDKDGTVKRTISLDGFDDTEDITWLFDDRFAVVEERRRIVAVFSIPADATTVEYGKAQRITLEPLPDNKKLLNKGLEGVAYVAKTKKLVVCKEKSPRTIYRFTLAPGTDAPEDRDTPWDAEANTFGFSDLSAISYDAATDRLLVLSDESKAVADVTHEGTLVGKLSFRAGTSGLDADVPQPEGITRDKDGTIYLVSEPNQLFVFKK